MANGHSSATVPVPKIVTNNNYNERRITIDPQTDSTIFLEKESMVIKRKPEMGEPKNQIFLPDTTRITPNENLLDFSSSSSGRESRNMS